MHALGKDHSRKRELWSLTCTSLNQPFRQVLDQMQESLTENQNVNTQILTKMDEASTCCSVYTRKIFFINKAKKKFYARLRMA
jgi:hypothetical protein